MGAACCRRKQQCNDHGREAATVRCWADPRLKHPKLMGRGADYSSAPRGACAFRSERRRRSCQGRAEAVPDVEDDLLPGPPEADAAPYVADGLLPSLQEASTVPYVEGDLPPGPPKAEAAHDVEGDLPLQPPEAAVPSACDDLPLGPPGPYAVPGVGPPTQEEDKAIKEHAGGATATGTTHTQGHVYQKWALEAYGRVQGGEEQEWQGQGDCRG